MNTKKIISSLILSVFSFFILMPTVFGVVQAQEIGDETWFNPSFAHFITKIWESDETEIYGERYTYAQTRWIIWSIVSWIFPDNFERCAVAISLAQESWTNIREIVACDELIESLTFTGSNITYPESQPFASVIYQEMTNNPMSGVGYVSSKGSDLGIVQEVYAQEGFGFGQLAPVQELWQIMRDITYFLLVLVAIVLAFMIMFRTKTSPQTVISVQSAIPKLVIALILITFSYAIAGFLVDLSYVVLGVFAIALTLPGVDIVNQTPTQLFVEFLSGSALPAITAAVLFYLLLFFLLGTLLGLASLGISGGILTPLFTLGQIVSLILMVVFSIFIIVVFFKIFWLLLKTFIQVVLLTIVGPIYILMGTMPGAGGVVAWMRSLAAQIMVFPIVIMMLFLSHFFFWRLRGTTVVGDLIAQIDAFNPYDIQTSDTLSGTIGLPGFNMSTGFMGYIGAFAILALTPHVSDIIKSLIERQPFGYGSAIGGAFGFVPWGARQGLGSAEAHQARKASLAQEKYDMWYAQNRQQAPKEQKAHIQEAAQRRRTMDYINRVRNWF